MTNYPKPANKPNATQILNKFILKHLCPKKSLKLFFKYGDGLGQIYLEFALNYDD